jgi:hypothetical protein
MLIVAKDLLPVIVWIEVPLVKYSMSEYIFKEVGVAIATVVTTPKGVTLRISPLLGSLT